MITSLTITEAFPISALMAGHSGFATRGVVREGGTKPALVESKGVGDDSDRNPFYYRQMDRGCRGGGQGSVKGDQVGKGEVLQNNEPHVYGKAEGLLRHRHLVLWSS